PEHPRLPLRPKRTAAAGSSRSPCALRQAAAPSGNWPVPLHEPALARTVGSVMADEQPSTQPVDGSLGFDRVLERLRQVVGRLEQGNLSLEQSLLAFEEGVGLSRRGSEILEAAERRVEILIRGEDGATRPQAFGASEGDG